MERVDLLDQVVRLHGAIENRGSWMEKCLCFSLDLYDIFMKIWVDRDTLASASTEVASSLLIDSSTRSGIS